MRDKVVWEGGRRGAAIRRARRGDAEVPRQPHHHGPGRGRDRDEAGNTSAALRRAPG